jgi:Uncharacterised protein family UPF0547
MASFALTTSARVSLVFVLVLVLLVVLYAIPAIVVARYGARRGYSFWALFWSAMGLGPVGWALVLLFVVLAVGRAEPARQRKQCPDCAESVLAKARVCKHCGYRFLSLDPEEAHELEVLRQAVIRNPPAKQP